MELISKEHGGVFINMHGMFYPDESLFSDTIHLNREAAEVSTKELIQRMEEEGIFQKINDSIVYRD